MGLGAAVEPVLLKSAMMLSMRPLNLLKQDPVVDMCGLGLIVAADIHVGVELLLKLDMPRVQVHQAV